MSRKKHKGLFVSILLATIFMVAFGGTFFLFSEQSKKQSAQNLTVVTSFYPMYIAAMNISVRLRSWKPQYSRLSEPVITAP